MSNLSEDERYIQDRREALQHYLDTGELGRRLMSDAVLAIKDAEHGWKSCSPEVAKHDKRMLDLYARIKTEGDDIHFKAKEFEFKHWMGFCDEDVKKLVKLYREWTYFDWDNETKEKGDDVRNMWNPSSSREIPHWQPYFARRDKKPLQKTLEEANGFLSATLPKIKVMMGFTAGSALLTVQDAFRKGHPEGLYDGATVTLIFDEDSPYPRGGAQGFCATRDEGVALIQAVIDDMPEMQQDDNVSLA